MRFNIILSLLLFYSSTAFSEWSTEDTQRQSLFFALHLMDWGQTLDVVSQPEKYYEKNRLLPKHPTRKEVNTFMVIGGLGHLYISSILPDRKRKIFQWASIVVKLFTVAHNKKIGLQIAF